MEAKAEQKAKRKEAIILRLMKGEKLRDVLNDYPDMKLSPATWSRLKRRYLQKGLEALIDRRKGLPYKLRPEIRDFLIATKDANPTMSCSELVVQVKEKYGLILSKSSINQVLRRAGMSGRVGRRPGRAAAKVKAVPEEAKPPPEEVKVLPVEAKVLPEEAKAPPEGAEAPPEAPPEEVKVLPEEAKALPMEYAGCFFLKGADCDLLGSHTITRAVKEEAAKAGKSLSEELLSRKGALQSMNELLLYLPLFGVKRPEDLDPSKRGDLSLLIGSDKLFNCNEIERYLRNLEDLKLLDTLAEQLARGCAEALAIRVELEDKASFYIDGHLKTLWPDEKIPLQFSISFSKIKSYINRFFLNGSKDDPLILSVCPGYIALQPELFDLMDGYEGRKNLREVLIISPDGSKVEVFKGIRLTRRYFIGYLSPWQYKGLDNFQIKSDFIDWKTPQYPGKAKIADAEINLIESQTGRELLARTALIQEEGGRLRAIITNITDQDEPDVKKVASAYFHRWPDQRDRTFYEVMQQGLKERDLSTGGLALSGAGLKQGDNTTGGTPTLTGLLSLLVDNLNRYAQNHYFPSKYNGLSIEEMVETFYKQKGYVRQEEGSITVTLDPLDPYDDPKLQEAVEYACRRFNEGDVKLPDGQMLRIFLR